jgi:3-dehydroquinate synthase
MKRVRIPLRKRSYDIRVGSGLLVSCGRHIRRLGVGRDAVVITNRRLLRLYGKSLKSTLERSGFSVLFETVPDSEKAKSIKTASRLLNRIARHDVRRRIFLIALGGGVVGDLTGFVASIYKRGIPYIQVPTTLLAQVDSAIGGKAAIDMDVAKNIAGSFYQPMLVISDTSVLRTLPARQIRNGMAEIIKYGVIKDAGLFAFLESWRGDITKLGPRRLEEIIARASRIKAGLVARDEFDRKGIRAALNYGHTIGHAVETACGYSSRYNHGEAVAIGMVAAARISEALRIIKGGDVIRIESLIKKSGLPTTARGVDPDAVYRAHLHDKKFIRGANRFVLPAGIGRVRIVEAVPEDVVRRAVKSVIA